MIPTVPLNFDGGRFPFPQIVITSYLGRPEVRWKRLNAHVKQRELLAKQFPKFEIVSMCSGYTEDELEYLDGYEKACYPKKVPKWIKHNSVLEQFYAIEKTRTLLLLDDDTFPVTEDMPFEVDVIKQLTEWLKKPKTMPGSCLFFSTKGKLHDAFFHKRVGMDEPIMIAPLKVDGRAILIKSDFGMLYDEKDIIDPAVDDYIWRAKAVRTNRLVLKHQHIFFRSPFGTEKASTLSKTGEERSEGIKAYEKHLAETYPWLFQFSTDKTLGIVGKKSQGKNVRLMAQDGLMIKTDFGYIPNAKALRAKYKETHVHKKGFIE